MGRNNYGITFMIENDHAAQNIVRQGLSYDQMAVKLERHFGIKVLKGSILYHFRSVPEDRKAWEKSRNSQNLVVINAKKKEEARHRSLEQKVLKQMRCMARKDPSFRDTIAYYRTFTNSHLDPETVYQTFRALREGKYKAQIMQELDIFARIIYNCCRIYRKPLPDGRLIRKR